MNRYLDEDLRIGRGPGRELYVLSKRDARATADAAVPPPAASPGVPVDAPRTAYERDATGTA